MHNLHASRTPPEKHPTYAKDVEETALTYLSATAAAEKRTTGLLALQKRADWKLAYPTEDHILPLYVTLGAGIDKREHKVWNQGLYTVGMSFVSFRLGVAA